MPDILEISMMIFKFAEETCQKSFFRLQGSLDINFGRFQSNGE